MLATNTMNKSYPGKSLQKGYWTLQTTHAASLPKPAACFWEMISFASSQPGGGPNMEGLQVSHLSRTSGAFL